MSSDPKSAVLTDAGEEVMASFQYSAKKNRTGMLQNFVDDAFEKALAELPEADRKEISRRMSKLFLNSFKTPEMDLLVRNKVKAVAEETASNMVDLFKPRIEHAVERELEEGWQILVKAAVRGLLADTVEGIGRVIQARLSAMAESMVATKEPPK